MYKMYLNIVTKKMEETMSQLDTFHHQVKHPVPGRSYIYMSHWANGDTHTHKQLRVLQRLISYYHKVMMKVISY